MSRYDRDDYDDYRPRRKTYRCGGYAAYSGHCGATDCETCYPGCSSYDEDEGEELSVETAKTVTARKGRFVGTTSEIRPGDRVRVTSGFGYERNGPRTGYFRSYRRVSKGPAWPVLVPSIPTTTTMDAIPF